MSAMLISGNMWLKINLNAETLVSLHPSPAGLQRNQLIYMINYW